MHDIDLIRFDLRRLNIFRFPRQGALIWLAEQLQRAPESQKGLNLSAAFERALPDRHL